MALRPLELADAELAFDPDFLDRDEADAALQTVWAGLPWQRHCLRMFGREVEAPRLSCWIGDPGASYRYSGTRFEPLPWPPALAVLRARVGAAVAMRFNSVLANAYRDGRDRMGWHADDEPELGPQPVIASLSLGAGRRFLLRHRRDPERRLALELGHGSLLIMRGDTQHAYRHALPGTARAVGLRLNLTFRRIVSPVRSPHAG